MLERLAEKLARAVLRGGGGGNVASLPDPQTAQTKVVSPSLHYGGSTGTVATGCESAAIPPSSAQ